MVILAAHQQQSILIIIPIAVTIEENLEMKHLHQH